MFRPASILLGLAGLLYLTAFTRDRVDDWVDATVLATLLSETSIEIQEKKLR